MDVSSDSIRGHIDIIILGLLYDKDMYGYEISKAVSTKTNYQYEMNEATMYSSFRRLEKNKLIESYYSDSLRGSKRRYYRLTTSGKAYYIDKCDEWKKIKTIIDCFIKEV